MGSLQYRKLDFEEFCAAAISVHQLEGMDSWEQHARRAYELFEKDGNRPIMIEELASVCSPFFSIFMSAQCETFLDKVHPTFLNILFGNNLHKCTLWRKSFVMD